jgi:hypothetical protein
MTDAPSPRRRERAASAIEYVLLAAGVVALVVLLIYTFGDKVTG